MSGTDIKRQSADATTVNAALAASARLTAAAQSRSAGGRCVTVSYGPIHVALIESALHVPTDAWKALTTALTSEQIDSIRASLARAIETGYADIAYDRARPADIAEMIENLALWHVATAKTTAKAA
jgi:hypothetical protein